MDNKLEPCPLCGGPLFLRETLFKDKSQSLYTAWCHCGFVFSDDCSIEEFIKECNLRTKSNRLAVPAITEPTNMQSLFGTPDKVADVLLPLLPTMEGFCPYCDHWIDGACKVNPNWDCKNALVNWLNSPYLPRSGGANKK